MSIIKRGMLSILFSYMIISYSGYCQVNSCPYDKQLSELSKLSNKYKGCQEYQSQKTKVVYETGLEEQAKLLAPLTDELILFVEKELNQKLNISQLTLFLSHAKCEMLNNEELNEFYGFVSDNGLQVAMNLFIPQKANLESIKVKNGHDYPCALFHELIEGNLKNIYINYQSTKDDAEKMLLTRWFREGFSNYAGYIAFKFFLSKINITEQMNKAQLYNGLSRHPFSNLNKIGKKLFKWHQMKGNPAGYNSVDYYDASLGLFLLIEDRCGKEAIAEIGKEVNQLNHADGKDLIALCNRIIGTDIVKLVDSFYFPDLGMKTRALFPPECSYINVPYGISVNKVSFGGMAWKAGIKKGDVIIKVNQKNISTDFDFEYIIFKSLQQKQIPIEIWRKDKGILSLTLNIK